MGKESKAGPRREEETNGRSKKENEGGF